jgi:Tol biopolymer transport system component
MASPTVTSSADTTASAERAAFAATWLQANQGEAEATALLYFGQNVPEGDTRYALWQMPLEEPGQPQKLADMPNTHRFPAPGARLSADEQWIAYAAPISDWPLNLHVMRVDGSNNQILTQTGNPSDCTPKFAWSHTGATLVYGGQGGLIIRSYDAATGVTREVSGPESSIFLGLDAQGRALMTPYPDDDQARNIVAVNLATEEHTMLGAMPSPERLYCRKLSPDGNQLLFNLHRTTYRFDVATRAFTPLDVVVVTSFWSNDASTLLTFSGDADNRVSVVPITGTTDTAGRTTISHVLEPTASPPGLFGVVSTSPDGRWLVGCHVSDDPDIHSYLYDVETDTWHLLAEGSQCVNVVGWTTQQTGE